MLSFRETGVEPAEDVATSFPGVPCLKAADIIPPGYKMYVLEDYPATEGRNQGSVDDLCDELDNIGLHLSSIGFLCSHGGARSMRVQFSEVRSRDGEGPQEVRATEKTIFRHWAVIIVPDHYDPIEVAQVMGSLADIALSQELWNRAERFVYHSSNGEAWFAVDGRRLPSFIEERFRTALFPTFFDDLENDGLSDTSEDHLVEYEVGAPNPGAPYFELPSILTFGEGFLASAAVQEKLAGRDNLSEALPDLMPNFEELKRLHRRWLRSGRNKRAFEKMRPVPSDEVQPTSYLVEGLIPRGMVTMIVGEEAGGKSSLAQHLAMQVGLAIEGKASSFLGRRICIDLGDTTGADELQAVAFFSAEEHPAVFDQRRTFDDPNGEASILLIGSNVGSMPIQELIAWLDGMRPALIVIDPLRSYLSGNEDKSEVINEFFDPLVKFATQSNAAVVVVHHVGKVGKGAVLNSVNAVWRAVRGSSVLTNRVRCGLSLVKRSGRHRILGVAKTNLVDGDPEGTCIHFELEGGQFVARETAPAPQVTSTAADAPERTSISQAPSAIVQAVSELDRAGERVTRTGPNSLFGRRHPSVAGMSRNQVDKAIAALVQSGELEVLQDGSLFAAASPGDPFGHEVSGGE